MDSPQQRNSPQKLQQPREVNGKLWKRLRRMPPMELIGWLTLLVTAAGVVIAALGVLVNVIQH